MSSNTGTDETIGQAPKPGDMAGDSSVLDDARSLWHELRWLSHDHFRLAALETRRAGESLVEMIIWGVMMAVLLSCAWLGLAAAVVLSLVENGYPASSAVLLAVACNLLLALILFGAIRHKSRHLEFPATQRSLQAVPAVRGHAHRHDVGP